MMYTQAVTHLECVLICLCWVCLGMFIIQHMFQCKAHQLVEQNNIQRKRYTVCLRLTTTLYWGRRMHEIWHIFSSWVNSYLNLSTPHPCFWWEIFYVMDCFYQIVGSLRLPADMYVLVRPRCRSSDVEKFSLSCPKEGGQGWQEMVRCDISWPVGLCGSSLFPSLSFAPFPFWVFLGKKRGDEQDEEGRQDGWH